MGGAVTSHSRATDVAMVIADCGASYADIADYFKSNGVNGNFLFTPKMQCFKEIFDEAASSVTISVIQRLKLENMVERLRDEETCSNAILLTIDKRLNLSSSAPEVACYVASLGESYTGFKMKITDLGVDGALLYSILKYDLLETFFIEIGVTKVIQKELLRCQFCVDSSSTDDLGHEEDELAANNWVWVRGDSVSRMNLPHEAESKDEVCCAPWMQEVVSASLIHNVDYFFHQAAVIEYVRQHGHRRVLPTASLRSVDESSGIISLPRSSQDTTLICTLDEKSPMMTQFSPSSASSTSSVADTVVPATVYSNPLVLRPSKDYFNDNDDNTEISAIGEATQDMLPGEIVIPAKQFSLEVDSVAFRNAIENSSLFREVKNTPPAPPVTGCKRKQGSDFSQINQQLKTLFANYDGRSFLYAKVMRLLDVAGWRLVSFSYGDLQAAVPLQFQASLVSNLGEMPVHVAPWVYERGLRGTNGEPNLAELRYNRDYFPDDGDLLDYLHQHGCAEEVEDYSSSPPYLRSSRGKRRDKKALFLKHLEDLVALKDASHSITASASAGAGGASGGGGGGGGGGASSSSSSGSPKAVKQRKVSLTPRKDHRGSVERQQPGSAGAQVKYPKDKVSRQLKEIFESFNHLTSLLGRITPLLKSAGWEYYGSVIADPNSKKPKDIKIRLAPWAHDPSRRQGGGHCLNIVGLQENRQYFEDDGELLDYLYRFGNVQVDEPYTASSYLLDNEHTFGSRQYRPKIVMFKAYLSAKLAAADSTL